MIRKLFPLLVFALFGYYLMGANFYAKLGMIDDHEIALFLGSDGRIPVYEIPKVILSTEVGQWGEYLRFRPSYYTLRVIESSLWRDDATFWYGARYLLFVLSMYLMWLIASSSFPKILSYLIVFYLFTMPFWPDLLTRLGPSEIYAVPAFLLFAYGLLKNNVWLISLGYAICVGAKENFLILFPFLILWAGTRARSHNLTKKELLTTLALTIFTFYITAGILLATARAGTDVYGTQISYRYRITKFLLDIPRILQNKRVIPLLIVSVLPVMLIVKEIIREGWRKYLRQRSAKLLGLMIALVAVMSSQYIFYINQLPSNTRYDFPAILLIPVTILVAILLLLETTKKLRYGLYIKIAMYSIIALACSVFIWKYRYTHIHAQALRNSVASQVFDTQITQVVAKLENDDTSKIVFASNHFIDYEPVVSVSRYLTAKLISNTFMIKYTPMTDLQDPLGRELQDRFLSVMAGNMGSDGIFDRFSRYEVPVDRCYSITFDDALPIPDCPLIGTF